MQSSQLTASAESSSQLWCCVVGRRTADGCLKDWYSTHFLAPQAHARESYAFDSEQTRALLEGAGRN